MEQAICERCLGPFLFEQKAGIADPTECKVCVKLGDRSLVWFLRAFEEAETEEDRILIRKRFAVAKGRSTT